MLTPWTLSLECDPYSNRVCLAFSPDDRWVAVVPQQGVVAVYDCVSREQVYRGELRDNHDTLSPHPRLLPVHPFCWCGPEHLALFDRAAGSHCRIRILEVPTGTICSETTLPPVTVTRYTKKYNAYLLYVGAWRQAIASGDGSKLFVFEYDPTRPQDPQIPIHVLGVPWLTREQEITLAAPDWGKKWYGEVPTRRRIWPSPDGWPIVAQYSFVDSEDIPCASVLVSYTKGKTDVPAVHEAEKRLGFAACDWISRTRCLLHGASNVAVLDLDTGKLNAQFQQEISPVLRSDLTFRVLDLHPDRDRCLVQHPVGDDLGLSELDLHTLRLRPLTIPASPVFYDRITPGACFGFTANTWELFSLESGALLQRTTLSSSTTGQEPEVGTSPGGQYHFRHARQGALRSTRSQVWILARREVG